MGHRRDLHTLVASIPDRSTIRDWLARVAIVVATVSGWACQNGGGPYTPDAATDGGVDAARDGGTTIDAARDGGHDAGTDPLWRDLSGFDEACHAAVAMNPVAAAATLGEQACPGWTGAGCRELVFPPPPGSVVSRVQSIEAGARWDPVSGTGFFVWFWSSPEADPRYVIADAHGVPRYVFRADPSANCWASLATVGDGRIAAVIDVIDGEGGATVGLGRIDDPGTFELAVAIPDAEMPAQLVQWLPVSSDVVALGTDGGAQLWNVAPTGEATRIAWGGEYAHYLSDVHANAIFAAELGADIHIAVSLDGGPLTTLVDPADGSDAFELRTDGVDMVWHQGYGRTDLTQFDRVELWTAPYTTDPTALRPRRVSTRSVPGFHHETDVYAGVVVDLDTDGASFLVHFLDGRPSRRFAPEPDFPQEVLFAGPDEVAMLVYDFHMGARIAAVRFYRYDSLPLAE